MSVIRMVELEKRRIVLPRESVNSDRKYYITLYLKNNVMHDVIINPESLKTEEKQYMVINDKQLNTYLKNIEEEVQNKRQADEAIELILSKYTDLINIETQNRVVLPEEVIGDTKSVELDLTSEGYLLIKKR